MSTRKLHRGIVLPAMVVVVGIIAVLIALLMPAVQKVREAANRTHALDDAKTLAVQAMHFQQANGHLANDITEVITDCNKRADCPILQRLSDRNTAWR